MTGAARISRRLSLPLTPSAAEIARRFQLTIGLAAVVGAVTGLGVAGFRYVVDHAVEAAESTPLALIAVLPGLGLIGTHAVLHVLRGNDRATTDAYVRAYHQRDGAMGLPAMGRKLMASFATMCSANALGLEGPSMLIGGSVGSTAERRFSSRLGRDDAKVLMVAGAAAGVAAVFKAPLTGVIFALEVPYRADLARRALLPTLVAAASSYVVFVAISGTGPLIPTPSSPPFDLRDLGGGAVLGLVCGLLARMGAWSINRAKQIRWRMRWRLLAASLVYVALAPIALWWFDEPVHLGPGYLAIEWATQPAASLWLIGGLFAVRAIATCASIGGGGVGGLFIPLVTQGAIAGAFFQQLVDAPSRNLFAAVGIAALLGAGYRTPLAGVAFVAEATGQPGYLVPALLAAATAQLAMGRASFSPYQQFERSADLRPLTRMTVAEILSPQVLTLDPGTSVDKAITTLAEHERRWAPLVDNGRYAGMVALRDLAAVSLDERAATTVAEVAVADAGTIDASETVMNVAAVLDRHDVAALTVVDADQAVVGIVTRRDVANVELVLDRLADDAAI